MATPLQPIAPSIDDPIELLLACHDKVRRFAHLCLRLRTHLTQAGADQQAQDAAQSILRYFEIAAPLHHDDEELDLFPALRQASPHGHQSAPLLHAIDSLQAEHTEMGTLWCQVRPWLQAITPGQITPAPPALDAFVSRYTAHAQREEDEVYPHAKWLSPEQLKQISAAMVARRTSG